MGGSPVPALGKVEEKPEGACYLTPSQPLRSLPTHSQAPRPAAPKNFCSHPLPPGLGLVMGGLTPILIGPEDEDVHGAHLSELVIRPVQPEDLLAALLLCLLLHERGGRLIFPQLSVADPTYPGSDEGWIRQEGDRAQGISREDCRHLARVPSGLPPASHRGWSPRPQDPVLVFFHQSADALQQLSFVKTAGRGAGLKAA